MNSCSEFELQNATVANCNSILIDPVLAYCASFLKNYSVAVVAEALKQFFNEHTVLTARDLLRRKCEEKLKDLDIIKVSQRRASANRQSFEANARDVAEAVYLLINEDKGPQFLIDDVRKLPLLGPSLATPKSQAETIFLLEKKFQSMETRMSANDQILRQHDEELLRCKAEKEEIASSLSNYGSLTLPPPAPGGSSWKDKMPYAEQIEVSKRSEVSKVECKPDDIKESNGVKSWASMVKQAHAEDEKWQLVQKEKKKMSPVRKRPTPMKGTAKETGIKAGKGPNRDIWVYNVDKDITDEEMKNYIEEGGSSKERTVDIRMWEPRYKDTHDSKCFRLTIAKTDFDYVFNPEFWPLDINFRKYWLSKKEMSSFKGVLENKKEINSYKGILESHI